MDSLRPQSPFSLKLQSIPSSSSTGSGGAISTETITNIFALIKVLGFVNVHSLCKFRQYSANITLEEICATVLDKYERPIELPKIDWLTSLNEEGLIKVQDIISSVLEKKRTILDAFKNGNNRHSEIEVVAIFDHMRLFSSRQIIARAGSFYLRENNVFEKDEEKEIYSYKDFFVYCKHELDWLNLSELELNHLDFREGNLTGTDVTNSDLSWTNLTGAAQEHMVVNGTDLSHAAGFKLYPSTQFNAKTNFKACTNIEIDTRPLADNKLVEMLNLFSIYSYDVDYPNWHQRSNIQKLLKELLSSETLLSVESLSEHQCDLLFSLFIAISSNCSSVSNSPYLKSLYEWLNKEILPKKIMAANSAPLNVRSDQELEYLTNYVVSSEDQKAFISQHRGFVIQLMCSAVIKGHKPYLSRCIHGEQFTAAIYSLYKEHAPLFFDLCDWELVCLGINRVETPDGLPQNNAIALVQPDTAHNTFKFEDLPEDLRAHIMKLMSVDDNLRLACTSTSNNTIARDIYLKQLDSKNELGIFMNKFASPITTWKYHPSWRHPEFLLSDTKGLLHAVRHKMVMGPRAIEKIRQGVLSWAQAKKEREEFDGQHEKGCFVAFEANTARQRYLLDGSMSEYDASRELSEQEQRNIASPYVQTLIDCNKLSTPDALALKEGQLALLYSEGLVDLIVYDKLNLDQLFKLEKAQVNLLRCYSYLVIGNKISINELLELLVKFPFLGESGWYQHYIYDGKLTLKEGIFLHSLKVKFEDGGWQELKKVIKQQSDQLDLSLPDNVIKNAKWEPI